MSTNNDACTIILLYYVSYPGRILPLDKRVGGEGLFSCLSDHHHHYTTNETTYFTTKTTPWDDRIMVAPLLRACRLGSCKLTQVARGVGTSCNTSLPKVRGKNCNEKLDLNHENIIQYLSIDSSMRKYSSKSWYGVWILYWASDVCNQVVSFSEQRTTMWWCSRAPLIFVRRISQSFLFLSNKVDHIIDNWYGCIAN